MHLDIARNRIERPAATAHPFWHPASYEDFSNARSDWTGVKSKQLERNI